MAIKYFWTLVLLQWPGMKNWNHLLKCTTTDLDIVMVIKPPLSLPTQNVLAYLAGYLLKKISGNECIECQEQLKRQRFHSPDKDTAKYQFLDCKTYEEGYLILPTATMITL